MSKSERKIDQYSLGSDKILEKDPGFKEMWKKKADDLVAASKEKKRKNLTSPSISQPI